MRNIHSFNYLNKFAQDYNAQNNLENNTLPIDNDIDLPSLSPEQAIQSLTDNYEDKAGLEDLQKKPVNVEEIEEQPLEETIEDKNKKQEYPEFANSIDAIRWAEANNEIVRISYITEKGKDLQREIEPHGQFSAKTTGNQILVTFDRTVGDIRAFILNNIIYYDFVGKKFNKKFTVLSR